MFRRIFSFSSALSLLLCVLLGAGRLWLNYTGYRFLRASNGHCLIVYVYGGVVTMDEYTKWPTTEPFTWSHIRDPGPRIESFWNSESMYDWVLLDREGHLAMAPPKKSLYYEGELPGTHWSQPMPLSHSVAFHLSDWMAITAILPGIWVFTRVSSAVNRYFNRSCGGCSACGYSLTGNTSGTCPECGTAIPQASQPA